MPEKDRRFQARWGWTCASRGFARGREVRTLLVFVDHPASIGALPLTVARDAGCQVAYLPDCDAPDR